MQPEHPDPNAGPEQPPDASSDRLVDADVDPNGNVQRPRKAPLPIQEIEKIEDDAMGG